MALTDFTIIRKSLVARRFTTVVTIITVAVAVGLLLLLLSMRESGRQAFSRGTGNMHILVSADASPLASVLNSVFYANAPQRPIRWEQYEKIAADGRIDFAIPVLQGDSFRGFPTLATTPEFFTRFQPEAGTPWAFQMGTMPSGMFDVVLGATAAAKTGAKIGDKLVITHGVPRHGEPASESGGHGEHSHEEFPYRVVGILAPTGSPHDRAVFLQVASSWMIHADEKRHADQGDKAVEPTIDNLTPDEKLLTGVYVRVKTRSGSEGGASIGPVFDELRRDVKLTVARPAQEVLRLLEIVGNVDRIIIGIAFVVLASSGVSIMLALYNSMEQRRRQIAVLRVLGASRGRIFGLVMTESALIGLMGVLTGVVLSAIASVVVAAAMERTLGLVIHLRPDPVSTVAVTAGAVILAAVAGLVPAVIAYRLSVVRNLRPLG